MSNDLKKIKESVEAHFNVNLSARDRKRKVVDARTVYIHIAYRKTKKSLSAIGEYINRDHSTVLYHVGKFKDLMKTDRDFKRKFEEFMRLYADGFENLNVKSIDNEIEWHLAKVESLKLKRQKELIYG